MRQCPKEVVPPSTQHGIQTAEANLKPISTPVQLRTTRYITGFTHGMYRYPAAAPPDLIREIVETYTEPGDLVLDPFVGGGTTLVEALAQGRRAVGTDANTLAIFVARAKTTPLSARAWESVYRWLAKRPLRRTQPPEVSDPRVVGLPRALRNRLSSGLASLEEVEHRDARRMARCSMLRLGQWAVETQFGFDRQCYVPTVPHLERKLHLLIASAHKGMDDFVSTASRHGLSKSEIVSSRTIALSSVWEDFPPERLGLSRGSAQLVLTSPPYPGVHVLYHRWQVQSRRETAAPYWVADTRDGFGASYYMMGSRTPHGQDNYFRRLTIAFGRIHRLVAADGAVVQLVAFSRPESQLPFFLDAMDRAGFDLAAPLHQFSHELTREVANRRWYARGRDFGGGREVLLVHRPR